MKYARRKKLEALIADPAASENEKEIARRLLNTLRISAPKKRSQGYSLPFDIDLNTFLRDNDDLLDVDAKRIMEIFLKNKE